MEKKPRREASKRQMMREQRLKKQRQQRLFVILWCGRSGIIDCRFFGCSTFNGEIKPVGSFVTITPVARPQANGTTAGDPKCASAG